MLNRRHLFLTCYVVIVVAGCSLFQGKLYLRHDLANLGPLALSPDNPYLATNLLLSREKENSPVLRGFLEVRGNPDAVEIRKKVFRTYRLYFFYVDKNEAYALEQWSGDWVIRGPVAIPGTILASLSDIPRLSAKPVAPVARVAPPNSRSKIAVKESTIKPLAPRPVKHIVKTALPKPESQFVNQKNDLLGTPPAVSAVKTDLPPAKGYQPRAALALPKATLSETTTDTQTTNVKPTTDQAEVSSSGDVLHHITFPGETLRMISNWYTGDTSNVERIARINGLENPNVLSLGQQIRIPRYLLTKTATLTEAEVAAWKRAHPVSATSP